MYYYVYLIKFNNEQFYIGSRKSKVTPEDDTKYWGSPVTYKHLWEDVTLEKTKHILKVCSSFDEMVELEIKLIKEAWNKYPDECLNRCATPTFHPEVIRASVEKRCKNFNIKSPDGEIIKVKNMSKFCRENSLNIRSISNVVSGKRNHHKGWTLPNTNLKEISKNAAKKSAESRSKSFIIKSPNGEILEGRNINKFCKENNLNQGAITELLLKKIKSYKGWTNP